jgi:crotonobetainyl-CoA:carnitine CoA-transferase CaiB-like acyl-CoA transferase
MKMPLQGIKVLDLSHMLPGPYCTMILADMGAEVLKVENPNGGDSFRNRKPFVKQEGTAYLMLNRNKKSIKLDLRTDEGKEIFLKLAEEYDVILEQFRPGVVKRLGIDYDTVSNRNRGIVYCSLSGYGQDGPYRDMPGHDINYLSISGLLDTIGVYKGAPVIPGIQIGDIGGGSLWAALSIVIALLGREKNGGQGQYLDVSMVDCIVPWLTLFISSYFVDGQVPIRGETKGGGYYACYNIYETLDNRYVSLGAAEGKFWAGFCEAVGRADLIADQYAEEPRRIELIEEVRALMKTKTQAEWAELLGNKDVCFTPVKNVPEVFSDPHIQARNMVTQFQHPIEGQVSSLSFPVKFSATPAKVVTPPPLYGEHGEEVLTSIGYSDDQIKTLREARII